jgi:outer membrane immunogenic protein
VQAAEAASFDYSGFYLGVNGGYSWGTSKTSTSTSYVPGSYFLQSDVSQINQHGAATVSPNNIMGGIDGGYNIQTYNVVFGVEADLNAFSASSPRTTTVGYTSSPGYSFTLFSKTATSWLITLRPRIGYAYHGVLLYLTGGAALAQIKSYQSFMDNFVNGVPSHAAASTNTIINKLGWSAGGGLEYAVSQNVTIKGEYLFVKFSNVNSVGQLHFNPAFTASVIPPLTRSAPFYNEAGLSASLFRVGVNYNFG